MGNLHLQWNFCHELQNGTSIVLTTEEFYVDDETLCLYVQVCSYLRVYYFKSTVCNLPPQIRSQNLYLWSNWSVAIVVPRSGSVLPDCTYQDMPGLSE